MVENQWKITLYDLFLYSLKLLHNKNVVIKILLTGTKIAEAVETIRKYLCVSCGNDSGTGP